MADLISKIKGVDNVTYDLKDEVSTFGGTNLAVSNCLENYNTGTVSYNNDTRVYTITNGSTTSTWGSGFQFKSTPKILVPYGFSYRISFLVLTATAATFQVDINNYAISGTSWSGNDNDESAKRTSTSFSIPANTWTKVVWGSSNTNSNNTDKVDIYVVDGFGYKSPTAGTTWQVKDVKVELGNKPTEWTPTPQDLATYSSDTITFFQ